MEPTTFNIITFIVGLITILVNIWIAQYNVGKNRKIYEITTINDAGGGDVNKILKSGDYTILHVSQCNTTFGSNTFVLGKLKKYQRYGIVF